MIRPINPEQPEELSIEDAIMISVLEDKYLDYQEKYILSAPDFNLNRFSPVAL